MWGGDFCLLRTPVLGLLLLLAGRRRTYVPTTTRTALRLDDGRQTANCGRRKRGATSPGGSGSKGRGRGIERETVYLLPLSHQYFSRQYGEGEIRRPLVMGELRERPAAADDDDDDERTRERLITVV